MTSDLSPFVRLYRRWGLILSLSSVLPQGLIGPLSSVLKEGQ